MECQKYFLIETNKNPLKKQINPIINPWVVKANAGKSLGLIKIVPIIIGKPNMNIIAKGNFLIFITKFETRLLGLFFK